MLPTQIQDKNACRIVLHLISYKGSFLWGRPQCQQTAERACRGPLTHVSVLDAVSPGYQYFSKVESHWMWELTISVTQKSSQPQVIYPTPTGAGAMPSNLPASSLNPHNHPTSWTHCYPISQIRKLRPRDVSYLLHRPVSRRFGIGI